MQLRVFFNTQCTMLHYLSLNNVKRSLCGISVPEGTTVYMPNTIFSRKCQRCVDILNYPGRGGEPE